MFHTGTRVAAPVRKLGYGLDGPEFATRLGTKFFFPCGIYISTSGKVTVCKHHHRTCRQVYAGHLYQHLQYNFMYAHSSTQMTRLGMTEDIPLFTL
jgi:hypothetical protein